MAERREGPQNECFDQMTYLKRCTFYKKQYIDLAKPKSGAPDYNGQLGSGQL